MNKIKFFLKRSIVWFRKHYYAGIGLSLFLILLVLLSPIIHSNWLYYPEPLKVRIALKKFIYSFEQYSYCREDCEAERLFYIDIIKSSLNSNQSYETLIQKEIFDIKIPEETRKELLKIYKSNNLTAPVSIKNFYMNSQNDFSIRAALVEAWPEISNTSFVSEVIGRYKNSASVKEKLALLDLLDEQSDDLIFTLLWNITLGDEGDDLKRKAFLLLSNIDRKDLFYKTEDLDNIKLILNDSNYEMRLKDLAIWLLNDYYQYFPVLSENILMMVANGLQFDNYQKTFAINILNYQKSANLKLPDLNQEDWNNYYKN
jgi:hypothetical protein